MKIARPISLAAFLILGTGVLRTAQALPFNAAFSGDLAHSSGTVASLGLFGGSQTVTVTGSKITVSFTYDFLNPLGPNQPLGNVNGSYTGTLTATTDPRVSNFTGQWVINGGSGPLTGASGNGKVSGTLSTASHGFLTANLTGTLDLAVTYLQAVSGTFSQPAGSFTTGKATNFGPFAGFIGLSSAGSGSSLLVGGFNWGAYDGEVLGGMAALDLRPTTTANVFTFTGALVVRSGLGQYDGAVGVLPMSGTYKTDGSVDGTFSGNLLLLNEVKFTGTLTGGKSRIVAGPNKTYAQQNGANGGVLSGGLTGPYTAGMTQQIDLKAQFMQGNAVWTLGSDQLFLSLTGPLDPTNVKNVLEGIDVVIVGGTGRYRNAGGNGEIALQLDLTTGNYVGQFTGWLIPTASPK